MNRLIKWLPALCLTMVAACASPQTPNAAPTTVGPVIESTVGIDNQRNNGSTEPETSDHQGTSENTGNVDGGDGSSTADQMPPRGDTSTGSRAPLTDLYWVGRPECAVGSDDILTILGVGMRAGGTGEQGWPSLVPYSAVTDTGSSGSADIETRDRSFTQIQLRLQERDFGRTIRVTVTADPRNSVPETDESNNTFSVTIQMPAGPSGSVPCPT